MPWGSTEGTAATAPRVHCTVLFMILIKLGQAATAQNPHGNGAMTDASRARSSELHYRTSQYFNSDFLCCPHHLPHPLFSACNTSSLQPHKPQQQEKKTVQATVISYAFMKALA